MQDRGSLRNMLKKIIEWMKKRLIDQPETFNIEEFTELRNHKPKQILTLVTAYDLISKVQAEDLRFMLTSLAVINFDYKLLVLGTGGYLSDVQNKVQGVRNSDNIQWLKEANHKHHIMKSDICVYYSRDGKQPVFVKECMACGLPIIYANFKKKVKLLRDAKYRSQKGKEAREEIERKEQ